MLLNNKVIVAQNCDIIEKDIKLCVFKNEEENKIEDKQNENQDKIPQEKRDDNDETESEDERKERRSRRQVKPYFDEEY